MERRGMMLNKENKYLIISFINNLFLSCIKVLVGYLTKCKTLLADGIHSLGDMLTDIIGFIGTKIASKEPDKDHPYGHGKAQYITSIFISIFIIVLGFKILFDSFKETKMIDNYYILIISIVSIILKYIVSTLLIKNGHKYKNNILITSGIESRYDILSSMFAFIFIVLSLLSNKYIIFSYADTLGSIFISFLTFKVGISLFLENFKLSLGEVELSEIENNNIKKILHEYKDIKNIRRVTIVKYGQYNIVNIDIEVSGRMNINKYYKIDKSIKESIRNSNSMCKYININVRPYEKH